MGDIIPIEIRPGYFVMIAGIPHDLSRAEAMKIAGVVTAMATQDDAAQKIRDTTRRVKKLDIGL